jgi:hypothetical protein
MNQKEKQSLSLFRRLYLRIKSRMYDSLDEWYWKNVRTILSNISGRLVGLVLDVFLVTFLLWVLTTTINQKDITIANEVFAVFFYLALLYYPLKYVFKSGVQIISEFGLNYSIFLVRRQIWYLGLDRNEESIRTLQVYINRVRVNLKDFIDESQIISPPMHNYELDRLQKKIDIFFNSISEVMFPINVVFSREEGIKQSLLEVENRGKPSANEQLAKKGDGLGQISQFDVYALGESMFYLNNALFAHTAPYAILPQRHPINLILLSKFFERWNNIVLSCENCKDAFEKAKEDTEKYYKEMGIEERQRRRRMWQLRDDALIVIISVVISTVVQHFLNA